jgi:glycosyltransferase involved in cell wall biosynthesis
VTLNHPVERRVLHFGNILNNGYLNSKFLRRRGWAADSVTIDYFHVQAQPEWEEVAVINPDLSQTEPDWNTIDLAGYTRPEWFHDVRLTDVPALADRIRAGLPSGRRGSAFERPVGQSAVIASATHTLASRVRRGLGRLPGARAAWLQTRVLGAHLNADRERGRHQLIDEFAAAYPDRRDQLTLADIVDAKPRAEAHAPLFALYPLVQAYSLDPISVLVNNPAQPLICFEHGTMREFPFEESARGRLYALALKKAERIFITNADCNRAAERLGLKHYTFIPHPVDEELYRPGPSPIGDRWRRERGCEFIFLAPARHHWKHCPPGLENSWFKRNDILIRALGRFFAARPSIKALVVFFEWGQEVALSKALIEECGFADRVVWEPIASKPVMRDYYNAADVVFDQFNAGIGTFGTVVPEALASAKPVLLNYKKELHTWCFPELPPAVHAATEDEIAHHVTALVADAAYRAELGRRGREWFMRHHSSRLVVDRMIDVYLEIAERHGWGWVA